MVAWPSAGQQFLAREELSRRLGQSFSFSVSWRSLESLADPEIQKATARFVAEADVICFSLSSGGELPQNVTKWIEKGLFERKTSKLCLLALVETGGMIEPCLSRAEIYLSHLSSAAGVDCLCYSDSIPIPRCIRNNHRGRQPRKRTRPAKRAPLNCARTDQASPIKPLFFPSRRRSARRIGRRNSQLGQGESAP
jgi:hypothetical protein